MSKRLIVCSDGTWNKPDQKDRGKVRPSNVAKLSLALPHRDDDGIEQRIFYDKGVGSSRNNKFRGGIFGAGLSKNVKDGYRFLVENYEPDDEIFLFGFSRGAFTVRSLGGLIRNSGLLYKRHVDKIEEAFKLYRRRDDEAHPTNLEARLFRRTYASEPRIKYIGVWDTVGALGIPVTLMNSIINHRFQFHDTKLSSSIENAFHALAIDEKRKHFRPSLWEQQKHAYQAGQQMQQVWFAGVHSNIGGGYEDNGLSDIAFLWMVEKAKSCGLQFNEEHINSTSSPDATGELRESRKWHYRLWRPIRRTLSPVAWSNEFAHRSTLARQAAALRPPYQPDNLNEFLQNDGEITPAANRRKYW